MDAIVSWLTSLFPHMAAPIARLIVHLVYAAILSFVAPVVVVVAFTYMERKVIARIQDRVGPNRAGPLGLLQGFADAVKMLTKEDITPVGADRIVYNLAPGLAVVGTILVYAVLPVAPGVIGADLNIGILYVVAVGGFGMLAAVMAGWSSNNKYALLSAFRVVAQLIAYEIPMVIAIIMVVLAAGSMQMGQIIDAQNVPFLFTLPVAFFIFFVATIAEIGRSPFDLLEAESEIVAGFHVEYSGFKFALFFIGEYMHLFVGAGLGTTLFLGGWRGPGASEATILGVLLGFVYFLVKTVFLIFLMMWVRGTFPRIRIDHLLDFGWKFLVPVGLLALVAVALVLKLPFLSSSVLKWVGMLVANIVVVVVSLTAVSFAARRSRSVALRGVAGTER
ncbi:MAG: NADH-quinone oxidoreductase subunit NuoH [Anaerolineales bacterium]|nr:MAG: NADH-quinone oxidoreductase subunit NuoH [Anaerolineales bacterium]